jgi:hypothetical protein
MARPRRLEVERTIAMVLSGTGAAHVRFPTSISTVLWSCFTTGTMPGIELQYDYNRRTVPEMKAQPD